MKTIRRFGTIAVAGVAMLVLLAAPALAKVDLRGVEINGPGITGSIVLPGPDGWGFLVGQYGPVAGAARPTGALGPAYLVTVTVGQPHSVETLRFYPAAADGAWFHLGTGPTSRMLAREFGLDPEKDGWVQLAADQVRMATSRGLPYGEPTPTPASAPAKIATVPVVDTGLPHAARTGIGIAAFGSILGIGAVAERRAVSRRRNGARRS